MNHFEYQRRAAAVYGNKETIACRAKGPNRAECLLMPKHKGNHEGNGFDEYGELYRSWRQK